LLANDVTCKLWNFVGNVTGSSSSYFLVAMAIQRAVSVTWPHHVTWLFTNRRVRFIIAAIVLVLSLYYSHLLYGFEANENNDCTTVDADYDQFLAEFAKAEAILFYLVPILLLLLTNTVLIYKLRESVSLHMEAGIVATETSSRAKKVNSVTLTAVTVSMTYVVLKMPYCVYLASSYIRQQGGALSTEAFARDVVFKRCGAILVSFEFAVNFYLYCLTGSKFRAEFRNLVVCWQPREKNSKLTFEKATTATTTNKY
jgi:G protein-coupled receptor 139